MKHYSLLWFHYKLKTLFPSQHWLGKLLSNTSSGLWMSIECPPVLAVGMKYFWTCLLAWVLSTSLDELGSGSRCGGLLPACNCIQFISSLSVHFYFIILSPLSLSSCGFRESFMIRKLFNTELTLKYLRGSCDEEQMLCGIWANKYITMLI